MKKFFKKYFFDALRVFSQTENHALNVDLSGKH